MLPEIVKQEIEAGWLQEDVHNHQYRLYEIPGTEETAARDIVKTEKVAKEIAKEIQRTYRMEVYVKSIKQSYIKIYNSYEKASYVEICYKNPIKSITDGMDIVCAPKTKEMSKIEYLPSYKNVAKFSICNLYGNIAAYIDRDNTWIASWHEEKENAKITNEIRKVYEDVCNLFPNGYWDIVNYIEDRSVFYYEGKQFTYIIRLSDLPDDYHIRIHCYL